VTEPTSDWLNDQATRAGVSVGTVINVIVDYLRSEGIEIQPPETPAMVTRKEGQT
jgi:hypothetical protein